MNIRDVAKMAGVSPATVSRALNSPNKVKPENLERIQQVIKKTNYKSNPFARNIIRQKTKNIVMIVPALKNSFLLDLVISVGEYVSRKGYMLNIINTARDIDYQHSIIEYLSEKADFMFMDGLIIAGATSVEKESVEMLTEIISVPMVIIEHASVTDKIDTVYVDEQDGIRMALSYLKTKGYRKLGLFTSLMRYQFTGRRLNWLYKSAEETGLIIDEKHIIEGDTGSMNRSLEAAGNLFENSLPDVIYAFNDTTALALLRRAYEKGINIPEDIGIICGEYSINCDVSIPSLTSIVRPLGELASLSVDILMERMENPQRPVQNIVLPVSLAIRETC